MLMRLPWKWVLAVTTAFALAGCASAPGVALPPGTLVLGEVMHVLTRDLVNASQIAPGQRQENLNQVLSAMGLTDAQIDQGRVVVLRDLIYWNNRASGNKYSQQFPGLVAEGVTIAPGSVVELMVVERGSVIERVRARSLAEGGCYYGDVAVGAAVEAMGAISLVGPRGSAALYCAGIEKEGWQRPRTYWHKLPGAAAVSTDVPPTKVSTEPAPEPPIGGDGMATLLIYLSQSSFIYFFDLPVWVDGEKATELSKGTCDIVLVPPGEHVIVAGEGPTGIGFSRRELPISVTAAERLVLEYQIDDDAIRKWSIVVGIFQTEKWEPQAYRFTHRPAMSGDTCAIRHPPKVLGTKAASGSANQP